MSDTTLKAIIDRFQAVLEASPISLTATRDAFSHDRQPNALLTNTYHVEDDGLQGTQSITNHKEARIDRLTVFVARKLDFAPQTAKETMETLLTTIERYLKADGLSNNYHVNLQNRRVTRPAGKDFLIGSVTLTVDYDFNAATS